VAGTTQTPQGYVRVIGVCIPWQSAHTNTGHKNRKNWEDHEKYLTYLAPLLTVGTTPLVVAGDFNQRIPQGRQPQRMYDSLVETFKGLTVSTVQTDAPALIDHIAHSPNLRVESLSIISDTDEYGKLSDHRGAVVSLVKV
jgi:endonuclease/exonuclease/phosphatase family metal-dependent hydrolase